MLNLMRKHAGSWMIKVVLFAIVLVFVFWGVGSFRSRNATQVAEINGQTITYEFYRQAYNNLLSQYRRLYGSNLTDEMLKVLQPGQKALDQLIHRILMLQEADRLEIHVTDHELDEAIRQIPAFQVNGVFDAQRASRILAQNNFTTADFRESYKEDLRIQKLRALILEGIDVSEEKARQWYDWYNSQVNLAYVQFSPDRYQDVKPTEEEIKNYFEANQDDYKTEPEVKVRYLYFDPGDHKAEVAVSADQIAAYYESHPDTFKSEKTVEARHILLKLDPQADAETLAKKKEKAMEIYAEAKSGKDFAKLASQYSEGPTRDKGGYLGTFKKETMVKPFADKAFSMKAGEISEPVRTQFGWHIIKVERINPASQQSLEEVSDRISKQLADEKARSLALEKAETVYDNVFDGDDLAAAAESFNVPVETTDFFTRQPPPQGGVGNPSRFAETAFELEPMAISEILDLKDGFYLMQVIDKAEPEIPPFEAVAEKVKTDVIKRQQNERAKNDAEKMLAALQKDKTFAGVAAQYDMQVMETGFFKRTGSIPKIGYVPQIGQAAFQLTEQSPLHEQAIKGQKGWYLIRLKERRKPDADSFAKEKTTVINQLTEREKESTYQFWLADLKSRGEIEINQELIQ